jgi:hypothetical protein
MCMLQENAAPKRPYLMCPIPICRHSGDRVAQTCSTTVDSPPDNDTNTYVHPQPQEHPPHSIIRAPPYWGRSSSACLLAAIQPCLTCCCHRFGTMLASSQDSQFAVDAAVTMWSEFSVGEAPECSGAHAGYAAASIFMLTVRRGNCGRS